MYSKQQHLTYTGTNQLSLEPAGEVSEQLPGVILALELASLLGSVPVPGMGRSHLTQVLSEGLRHLHGSQFEIINDRNLIILQSKPQQVLSDFNLFIPGVESRLECPQFDICFTTYHAIEL